MSLDTALKVELKHTGNNRLKEPGLVSRSSQFFLIRQFCFDIVNRRFLRHIFKVNLSTSSAASAFTNEVNFNTSKESAFVVATSSKSLNC